MSISLLPLLEIERSLYEMPRDMARFNKYKDLLTGGTGDMVLPMANLNPMAKGRVLDHVNELIAMDAEAIASGAIAAANRRLDPRQFDLKVGLIVGDDIHGGWTDRYLTDAAHRLEGSGEAKRFLASVLLWASEPPTPADIHRQTLMSIYRRLHAFAHGDPQSLRDCMLQEGRAAAFAGCNRSEDPSGVREIIDLHRNTREYPLIFSCLYGDEAAAHCGY